MNKRELFSALDSIGMRPGRGLGQNFLLDNNLLDSIVRLANPVPDEVILEVGPGFGVLTRKLLETGADVYAVEFDHRIAEYLRKHLEANNFHLLEADACRVNYRVFLPAGRPFRVIANLPYSISTIFIARMLELQEPPEGMLLMLQREMGERLVATPGSKEYGAISVRVQLSYQVTLAKVVPPEVFFPPPEVESALVAFQRLRRDGLNSEVYRKLPGVVKTVFAQRRKQLGKLLGQNYGKPKGIDALAKLGLSPEIRPDKLTVEQYIQLTRLLFDLD